MKLQIDIPEEASKKLKIYKIENNLNTQEEALIEILNIYFKLKKED